MRAAANFVALVLALGFGAGAALAWANDPPPPWAYPVNPPGLKPVPDDGVPRHVPDSDAAFTLTQIRDLSFAPDWHPEDHPAMPEVVARGRKPDVLACGSCHRADGAGGPENARLAGLSVAYIAQQLRDFKSGARGTSVPERLPPKLMIATAKAINDGEIEAAAEYFSALKPRSTIRVVEAENVPNTHVVGWHLALAPEGGTEPIGERIIEVPENLEDFESRDGRARFIAYVPPGSIQKGQALATAGVGRGPPCRSCHGPDLKGLGQIPGIAGRSPSYIVRQLYDFRSGVRAGIESEPMRQVADKLSMNDILALAAYAASLTP
ncbi:MAG: c-type cytochrome [Acetobacteraceae bacterium]|nr:c-type cytochrome [Acetobacteraceae bacterium]